MVRKGSTLSAAHKAAIRKGLHAYHARCRSCTGRKPTTVTRKRKFANDKRRAMGRAILARRPKKRGRPKGAKNWDNRPLSKWIPEMKGRAARKKRGRGRPRKRKLESTLV